MRLALLALTTVVVSLKAAPAAACSPPPTGLWTSDPPANGVLVVHTACGGGGVGPCFVDSLPDTLTVTDMTTLDTVPGVIVREVGDVAASNTFAWKPATPFVEGRSYELDWNPVVDPWVFVDREFVAQPALGATLDDVPLGVGLDLLVESTEDLQCEGRWIDSCGFNGQIVRVQERTLARLTVFADVPFVTTDQYGLRGALWAEGQAEPALGEESWPLTTVQGSFEQAASAYCYRVELRRLVDDSTDVRTDCVEHGELGEVTTLTRSDAQLASDLVQCKEPPAGFEAQWCTAMRDVCATPEGAAVESFECTSVEPTCEGFDEPGDPDASVSDASGVEPVAPDGGDAGDGETLHDDAGRVGVDFVNPKPDDSDGSGRSWGCSVGGARDTGGGSLGAFLALLSSACLSVRSRRPRRA